MTSARQFHRSGLHTHEEHAGLVFPFQGAILRLEFQPKDVGQRGKLTYQFMK